MPKPGADVDFEGDLQPIVDEWTVLYAATDEMHEAESFAAEVPAEKQVSARGIEVGHIFYFGTKYSEPMKAVVAGPDGEERPVHMGSYGDRPEPRWRRRSSRRATTTTASSGRRRVAPFKVGLVNLKVGDAATDGACEDIYAKLGAAGVEVLYDDTDERAGAKFATMDLIGLPWQLIVGPKGLAQGTVELKSRATGERQSISIDSALARLTG